MNTSKEKSNSISIKKPLIIALFALFIIALIWVIVFKCNMNETLHIESNLKKTIWERIQHNLIPFKLVFEKIAEGSVIELLALIFNVVCFIPFGALLCFLTKQKTAILSGFLFSFCVEIFQLFSGWGGIDFMDVVLNGFGAILGVILYNLFFCKFPPKIVNVIAIVGLALVIPMDTFAIINTILHFPI